jgi:hypothetical protein
MGASLTMIDRHYGHLARDGREHAIRLLEALNTPEFEPWTLDAAWSRGPAAAAHAAVTLRRSARPTAFIASIVELDDASAGVALLGR